MTRGLSNNNPGNIRRDKTPWQGLAAQQNDAQFFQFESPIWGIRAISRILITYQDKYGCGTIGDAVKRWAPPTENDTGSYIHDVCVRVGYAENLPVDFHEYEINRAMVEAIIWHENGAMPYTRAQIDEGLKLAGIVQSVPQSTTVAMAKDPKVIAATVAGTAATVQATVSSVSDIWDTLATKIDPRYLVWSCVAIVVGFAVWFAIQKFQARKQGLA